VRTSSRHYAVAWLLAGLLAGLAGCAHPQIRTQAADDDQQEKDLEVRTIGELTTVDNVQPLAVSGVGVVTGLSGTGGSPKGFFRTMLEDQLRKQRPLLEALLHQQHLKNVVELLDSRDNALVLVAGMIPAGARKGDKLDLEVTLPPQSQVTSLRGGVLQDCVLYTYNTTRNLDNTMRSAGMAPNLQYAKPDQLLKGPIVARARGALVVGLGDGDDAARVRSGHIWEGGVSRIDRPFCLVLNNDRQFKEMLAKSVAEHINKAAVTNAVAERINGMYQEDGRQGFKRLHDLDAVTSQINTKFPAPDVGRGEMAQAMNRDVVNIKVPYEYRLNPQRYLLVVRLIPLRDTAEVRARYRHRLEQWLLDPTKTVRAALRLEALGKDSIVPLKNGLSSDHVLVRFCCAEALAYLGSPACAEELAHIARENEQLRSACLMALASLDEAVCHRKLAELMAEPTPDLRYGAFLGLRKLDDRDLQALAEQLNESFWLHRVVPNSPPLVHLSTTRRAEIVFFGQEPRLVPPAKILAGPEFTITADEGASRCVVSRFLPSGKIYRQPCSMQLEKVIRTMADMGGQYPDVVDLLRKAEDRKCLNCAVTVDALPPASSVVDLARGGRDGISHPDTVAGAQ
jgi:Flagellar P-ring protein